MADTFARDVPGEVGCSTPGIPVRVRAGALLVEEPVGEQVSEQVSAASSPGSAEFQMYQARASPTVTCWAAERVDGSFVRKEGGADVVVPGQDFALAWELYSRRRQSAAVRKLGQQGKLEP